MCFLLGLNQEAVKATMYNTYSFSHEPIYFLLGLNWETHTFISLALSHVSSVEFKTGDYENHDVSFTSYVVSVRFKSGDYEGQQIAPVCSLYPTCFLLDLNQESRKTKM
jgi:hypothetical protein